MPTNSTTRNLNLFRDDTEEYIYQRVNATVSRHVLAQSLLPLTVTSRLVCGQAIVLDENESVLTRDELRPTYALWMDLLPPGATIVMKVRGCPIDFTFEDTGQQLTILVLDRDPEHVDRDIAPALHTPGGR